MKFLALLNQPNPQPQDGRCFNLVLGTIHLRRQHILGGEGCPHGPMVKRSQYIRIKNPLHKHFAGMSMVGGQGSKVVKICRRLKWMVPQNDVGILSFCLDCSEFGQAQFFLNVFLIDKTSKKHVFVLIFLFQKNIAKYKKIKAKTIESQHFSKLKFLDGQASQIMIQKNLLFMYLRGFTKFGIKVL